jgi:hypothetical protein
MAEDLGTAEVQITASLAPLARQLDEAKAMVEQSTSEAAAGAARAATQGLQDFGQVAGGLLRGLTNKFANLLSVFGAGFAIREWVALMSDAGDAEARLGATLKATGDASGYTTAALESMARELEAHSEYSHVAIENAEALALTFQGIAHNTFPRFIQAALDMATVTGTDLNGAVERLGRALQDPREGMMLLHREGIVLGASQQALLDHFLATGNQARAQALILGEVERRFGGAAVAARDTLGGALDYAGHETENLIEAFSAGSGLTGALRKVANAAGDAASALAELFAGPTQDQLKAEIAAVNAEIAGLQSGKGTTLAERINLWLDGGKGSDYAKSRIESLKLELQELNKALAPMDAASAAAAKNAHVAPYVDPKAADSAKQLAGHLKELRQQTEKYIGDLRLQAQDEQLLARAQAQGAQAVAAANREIQIAEAEHRLNASATAADRAEVAKLAGQIYDAKEATRQLADEQRKQAEQARRAQELIDSAIADAIPPAEKYRQKIGEITAAIQNGMVPNILQANEAIKQLQKEMSRGKDATSTTAAAMQHALDAANSKFIEALTSTDKLNRGWKGVGNAALGLAQDIEKLVLQLMILNPMIDALTGAQPGQQGYLPTAFGASGGPGAGAPSSPGAAKGAGAFGALLSMVENAASGLGNLAMKGAIPGLENLAASGAAGFESLLRSGWSSLASLFGFASGGSFDVGGSGGVDSQVVMFKATPGEHVQVGPGSGGANVNVQVHNYSGHQAKVSQQPNGNGGQDIYVQIGDAMAQQVRHGGSLGRAVRDTFGSQRVPIQR